MNAVSDNSFPSDKCLINIIKLSDVLLKDLHTFRYVSYYFLDL